MTIHANPPAQPLKRIVSGIQPTGGLHLGNYLGAIKNWVAMQDQGECFYFLADLHAISEPIAPATLHNNVREMTAMLLACGIDPKRTALFSQMTVPEHTELQWILTSVARMGWLNRMTQYRDKGGNDTEAAFRAGFEARGLSLRDEVDTAWVEYDLNRPSVGVGVFAYPLLQAADVLLYGATHVPVGDDQSQHLQLARDVAQSFNARYGEYFALPQPVLTGLATRVMSLKNGTKKMSKSDPDEMTRINLRDDDNTIMKKYRRATTDTLLLPDNVEGLAGRPEVTNLVTIYAALTDRTVPDTLLELAGQGHGVLKNRLGEATHAVFAPIREHFNAVFYDSLALDRVLERGYEHASMVAGERMPDIRRMVFGYN